MRLWLWKLPEASKIFGDLTDCRSDAPRGHRAVRMLHRYTEMPHCALVVTDRSERTGEVAPQERVAGVLIDLGLELMGT